MDFYELRRKSAATPRHLEMILAVLDAPHHQPRPRCSTCLPRRGKGRGRGSPGLASRPRPARKAQGRESVPAMRCAVTPRCTALPSIKVRRRSQGSTFRAATGGGAGLDEVAVAPAGPAPRFGPVPIPLALCAAWDTHGAPPGPASLQRAHRYPRRHGETPMRQHGPEQRFSSASPKCAP